LQQKPDALLDLELAKFHHQWLGQDQEVTDTLAHIADSLEHLRSRMERLEDAYIQALPQNEWGATEFERIVGWRLNQIALGKDPKDVAHKYPPEGRVSATPRQKSVLD
jgi:hypothetical protein